MPFSNFFSFGSSASTKDDNSASSPPAAGASVNTTNTSTDINSDSDDTMVYSTPKKTKTNKAKSTRKKARQASPDSVIDLSNAQKDDADDDSAVEELADDEYIVEKLVGHIFKNGRSLEYEVKWEGYKETTWEPAKNLDGCDGILEEYWQKIGGKPKPEKKQPESPSKSASKKRKAPADEPAEPEQDSKTSTPVAKKPLNGTSSTNGATNSTTQRKTKRPKVHNPSPVQEAGGKERSTPPEGSWEEEVVSVKNVERDSKTSVLYASLEWTDGHISKHSFPVVYLKCPQKMLIFYENHLQFNTTQSDAGDED